MKLHVVLVGCPQDQQELLLLNHQLTLRVPAISIQTLQYSYLLTHIHASKSLPNSLFVIFSQHLKIEPYLKQLLNTITASRLRAIFYPLAINNQYQSVSTWDQIIKSVESVRDRLSRRGYQLVVYFLNNSDSRFRESMSVLYSKFINNQNVKFYNINRIQDLGNQLAQGAGGEGGQKRILVVSQADIGLVGEEYWNHDKVDVVVFNPSRKNNFGKDLIQFGSVEEVQREIQNRLKGGPRSSQSLSSSKYSGFSVDSRSSKNSETTNKLSKVYSNKLIQSKISPNKPTSNVRLIILDNFQNNQFRNFYHRIPSILSPTVLKQIPTSLSNDKPTLIITPVQNKSKILRLYPSVDCIFFALNPLNHQGMKNHNILITNSEAEMEEFMVTRGVSFLKQQSPRSPGKSPKSVKFADEIESKNSPNFMSLSQSSLLNTDNSNIIKNLNKNKKKKAIQEIQEVMSEYDIGNFGGNSRNRESASSLAQLPASSSFSRLPSFPSPVSPNKPAKQLKIEKTVNIHTNPRPTSVSSTTSISQNFQTSSQSLLSQAPTLPLIKKGVESNQNQELWRATTAKTGYNRNQRVSMDTKKDHMLTAKFDRATSQRPVSTSPQYSHQHFQPQPNPDSYYNSPQPPLQIPSSPSLKGRTSPTINTFSGNHNKPQSPLIPAGSNKSIIDAITPLTEQQEYSQIIFKQKYSGMEKGKGNIFIIPETKQSYLENVKRIASIKDDIASYRTEKSLEGIQFSNYKLAFVFCSDKMKYPPELCHYIPNLYVVQVARSQGRSQNVKEIYVKSIVQLKEIIKRMGDMKPTTFSFCPKDVESVGTTMESNIIPSTKIRDQMSIPVVLFSSSIGKEMYPTLKKRFPSEITSAIYSNESSLLNQLKIYSNQPTMAIIQPSSTGSIPKLKSVNPNIEIVVFDKKGKLPEKYQRDPRVKMVNSPSEMLDQIQFLTRI